MITICYLTYYAPGVMPVREHLENGVKLNPHGHGYAMGNAFPAWSLNRPELLIEEFMTMRPYYLNLPALFHSRNAAGDSPVTLGNVQPFLIQDMTTIVAHNGYLFPHEGERSDSLIFADEILPRYDLDDQDQVRLLEKRMGPSKAVILRPGNKVTILNEQLGHWLDGTWHSNHDYLGIPHQVDGQCPQCHAETDLAPVCESCEEKAQRRRSLLMDAA